jgi:hypothetical protein
MRGSIVEQVSMMASPNLVLVLGCGSLSNAELAGKKVSFVEDGSITHKYHATFPKEFIFLHPICKAYEGHFFCFTHQLIHSKPDK